MPGIFYGAKKVCYNELDLPLIAIADLGDNNDENIYTYTESSV